MKGFSVKFDIYRFPAGGQYQDRNIGQIRRPKEDQA